MKTEEDLKKLNAEVVKEKALKLEIDIRRRNTREAFAGLIVAAIFIKMSFEQNSSFEIIACLEIAFSGFFITFYVLYSHFKSKSSTGYLENYKENLRIQIRLLSGVRYWYVLPIATGYFALHGYGIYEKIQNHSNISYHLISIGIMALLGLFIIYINEYVAVKELRKELDSLYNPVICKSHDLI